MEHRLKSPRSKPAEPLSTSRAPGLAALQEMPGHLVRRAHQVSTALFAEECRHFDLTSVQFAALFVLRAAGELDATRLAELIAFDRSTIGDVIERLELKGWIARTGSGDDRRVKLIRLTPGEGAPEASGARRQTCAATTIRTILLKRKTEIADASKAFGPFAVGGGCSLAPSLTPD